MKSILLSLLLVICTVIGFAQTYPLPYGNIGSPATGTQNRGGMFVNGMFQGPHFTDTIAANASGYAANYVGSLIYTTSDDNLWKRNNTITKWDLIGSGSGYDTVYTKAPIAVYTDSTGHQVIYFLQNGLISGGIVTQAACLQIGVTAAVYGINYKSYSSAATILNVAGSDPSNPRTDAVVADTSGNVYIIEGTPETPSIAPAINPSSQVLLGTYTILAGASCVGLLHETIYDQNLGATSEWNTSSSGTITTNFSNTVNPYHLTIADFTSSYADQSQLIFSKGSNDTAQASEVLNFFVYLIIPLTSNQMQISFYNGSTLVGNTVAFNVGYGLNPNNTTAYQNISIPFSAFNLTNQVFTKMIIQFAGNDLSGAGGMYIDYIQLQTGGTQTNTQFVLTTNGSSGASTYNRTTNVLNIPIYGGGSGGGGSLQDAYDTSVVRTENPVIKIVNSTPFTVASQSYLSGLFSISESHGDGAVMLGDFSSNVNGTFIGIDDASKSISMTNIPSGAITDSILTINTSTNQVRAINSSYFTSFANNGLSLSGDTVQLGGTLNNNTAILNNGFNFNITDSATNYVLNLLQKRASGTGISVVTTGSDAGYFEIGGGTNNSILQILSLNRTSTSNGAPGMGEVVSFGVQRHGAGDMVGAGSISVQLSDTSASPSAIMKFANSHSGNGSTTFQISGTGQLQANLYGGRTFYVNDTVNYKPLTIDNSGNINQGSWSGSGGSGVTNIATGYGLTGGPITSTGTIKSDTTAHANGTNTGYLDNIDWTTFNNKQNAVTRIDSVALATAGQTAFTFTNVPSTTANYSIYVNGVKWTYGTGYTTSGNVVTLTTAMFLNDAVEYIKEL